MKKYRLVAFISLAYLVVLVVWVAAFITNLPASRVSLVAGATDASEIRKTKASSDIRSAKPVNDYGSLVSDLSAMGATVTPIGKRALTLLNGQGQVIMINGVEVQVFEYADISTADAQSSQISADGETIGYKIIAWSNAPHFYKKGKLIVLYVGQDSSTLNILRQLLGSPFAGN